MTERFRQVSHARWLGAGGAFALVLGFAGVAGAIPGIYSYVEDPACDAHSITLLDELGNPPSPPYGPSGPFPDGEMIASKATTAELQVCSTSTDDPTVFDYEVTILNLTPLSFTDLFFVADPPNSFSNFDGTILGGLAMKLDTSGFNMPLIAEIGGTLGLVFEPGEEWVFIVQDWADLTTPGATPILFNSIGVGTGSGPPSNASIVATPQQVSEPATLMPLAMLLGLLAFAALRRSAPIAP